MITRLSASRRTHLASIATTLILLCLASTGCDEMAGAVMELALDKGSENAEPGSLAARLKAEQATCPRQINEHTTLKSVSLKGVNRIKYLYQVTESGRPEVNMTVQSKVRRDAIQRAKSSHVGPAIVNSKLGIDHIFEDADGKCLLWLEMSYRDLEDLEFEEPKPTGKRAKLPTKAESIAARSAMLARLKVAQEACPQEIDEHTTLKRITLKGKNRLKYHYLVTAAGRKVVNMNNESEIRQQVIDRTKETPLGASIVECDLGVEHFYQDPDGQCTLWLNMTSKDFVDSPPEPEAEADPTAESESPSESADPQVAASDAEPDDSGVTSLQSWIPSPFGGGGGDDIPPGVKTNPYVK